MTDTANILIKGKSVEMPVITGTEHEHAIDISSLRSQSGYITLDDGYRNTGSCQSAITFIDPEKGILRYRGIPIEQFAQHSSFLETAWTLIYGELPSRAQLDAFTRGVANGSAVSPELLNILKGFPRDANPMAMISACVNGLCGQHPEALDVDYGKHFDSTAMKLIGQIKTITAAVLRHRNGQAPASSSPGETYTADFLNMMFGAGEHRAETAAALDLIFLLHADHEQNCSASTVRMVGSSHANLFTSCAAGICALWGPLHGGANVEIMEQLQEIKASGVNAKDFLEGVKAKKYRLFGFGHPIYRNYDPRARILKAAADRVLARLGVNDPLLDLAKQLESAALADDYFVSRKLYPNVDFYSGIIMRAMGIPVAMFTAMFAVGRMPGWIAQWKEVRDTKGKIYRPRQIYVGKALRDFVPIQKR
ncbi:MAG: citrate synthase [Phycisphaeraceae bacterium]|nr:citrate synthase [Phycisphaeraceae bacterium]